MRVNVYTEELLTGKLDEPFAEIATAKYVSSRTGEEMTNYGLRVFLKSPPELHYIPGRDDDRSAVTFWCGSKLKNVSEFIDMLKMTAELAKMIDWRSKTEIVQAEAEAAEAQRKSVAP